METTILFTLLWAAVCYKMAQNRHRDPVLGVIGGLLFGLFAVLYYAIVGDKNNPNFKRTKKGSK